VALAVSSGRARATTTDLPVALEWQAPPECYSADTIRAELARITRVRPGRTPAKLNVRGRIELEAGEYRLSLTVERNGDVLERHLASGECRALGREVTLVVALAFGEGVELVEDESGTEPKGDPTQAQNPQPEPPKQESTAAAASAQSAANGKQDDAAEGRRAAVFAGGGVLLRALPSVAGELFVGAELGWRRAWLAPELDILPGVHQPLERGVDARFDGLGGGLSLCLGQPVGTVLLAACATPGVMAVRGRSSGATESGSAVAPWYTAGIGISGTWPARGLIGVRLGAALLVSLNQPRFVVEGLGVAHEIPRLVPSFTSSIVLRL